MKKRRRVKAVKVKAVIQIAASTVIAVAVFIKMKHPKKGWRGTRKSKRTPSKSRKTHTLMFKLSERSMIAIKQSSFRNN